MTDDRETSAGTGFWAMSLGPWRLEKQLARLADEVSASRSEQHERYAAIQARLGAITETLQQVRSHESATQTVLSGLHGTVAGLSAAYEAQIQLLHDGREHDAATQSVLAGFDAHVRALVTQAEQARIQNTADVEALVTRIEALELRIMASGADTARASAATMTTSARLEEAIETLQTLPLSRGASEKEIFLRTAPGELVDRLSILDIKLERISDPAKLANVKAEHGVVLALYEDVLGSQDEMKEFRETLREINGRIWDLEDEIRAFERSRDFGDGFVAAARKIYATNDERASVKRQINVKCDSDLIEEKSYTPY